MSPEGSMSQSLTERYDDRIAGVLSCYDRLVITGTLPVINWIWRSRSTGTRTVVCYAAGMTGYLNAKGIRIFDYPEFAKTLRDRVRERAASLAAEAGITIEHIAKPHIRKEDVVARVLRQRGDRPGLVHIISAMEACDAYKPWHDKQTHKTFLRPDSGKCLHYYFYVQDAKFGLVYLRVPTWAPFRLQFYCNGHSWLARKLTGKGIGYTMADNTFVRIDDWALAQALADTLSPDQLHRTLDRYARVNIAGIRRSELMPDLDMLSPTRLSRQLRRLLDLGVIKRVTGTYRYYLTKAGCAATAAAERIIETVVVPVMI
jgi:hypothetical protein